MLADLERAIADAARAGQGAVGRLSLSFIHSSGYALLPAILRAYRRAYPDVALDLHEMTILEQTEALRRGRIDMALLRPPLELPGVELVELALDPFMLVVPAGHRLAAQDAASLSELKAEPFILFSRTTSVLFHTRINAMCYAAGFTPKIVQEATHIHTVLGLVQADYGVAIVPAIGRTIGVPGVKWLTIADAPAPVSVALAWRTEADAALVRGFRDVAVEVASRFVTDGVVAPR